MDGGPHAHRGGHCNKLAVAVMGSGEESEEVVLTAVGVSVTDAVRYLCASAILGTFGLQVPLNTAKMLIILSHASAAAGQTPTGRARSHVIHFRGFNTKRSVQEVTNVMGYALAVFLLAVYTVVVRVKTFPAGGALHSVSDSGRDDIDAVFIIYLATRLAHSAGDTETAAACLSSTCDILRMVARAEAGSATLLEKMKTAGHVLFHAYATRKDYGATAEADDRLLQRVGRETGHTAHVRGVTRATLNVLREGLGDRAYDQAPTTLPAAGAAPTTTFVAHEPANTADTGGGGSTGGTGP